MGKYTRATKGQFLMKPLSKTKVKDLRKHFPDWKQEHKTNNSLPD